MSSISHLTTDCQEEIPFYTEDEIYRNPADAEPVATPLADFYAEWEARKAQAIEVFEEAYAETGDLFEADQAVIDTLRGDGHSARWEPKTIVLEEVA